ncbi:unnamed protein product [Effrenium voratum]|uniref:Uncharacterized protein n=1 Tax=Effrenium voratum TaxID=2562239 RepID=A0AA36N2U5_9DINO|nr:unnamed protein product [Effrenium voratum]CAJ1441344.1 unnamed protein product [Effrenium voratum]
MAAVVGHLRLQDFPDHYQPVYDFIRHPMPPAIAVSVYIVGVYFLVKTYFLEREVVGRAHKKFQAHGNKLPVAIHGVGSVVEMAVGCAAVCNPDSELLAKAAAYLALFVNVPSGAVLTSRVFGIKHLTVAGFAKFGVLRTMEAYRVLYVDYRLVPNLWILLQVGTVVRLLGWFVLPYSSSDGTRGDLFTEPAIYSFNILLSGYLVAAFVYPPELLLISLSLYATTQLFWPPRMSVRLRPKAA